MKRIIAMIQNQFLIGIAFFTLFACQSVKVTTDFDSKTDFSKIKTYAIYRLSDTGPGLSELNRNRILDAINTELQAKGLQENPSNPDVLINVTTIVEEKRQVTATNYYSHGGIYRPYYWGPRYGQTQINVSELREGSLIIDIVDAASRHLIWEGIGNKEIDLPMNNGDKVIPQAVKAILEKFPPKANSK